MERKAVSGIMLTLILICMLTLAFNIQVSTHASPDADWLSGWSYRKSHVIHNASGAGANYQIKIEAHYGSGTDDGEDVYLNYHSEPDFGDVRFTADDGITELDYWMEEFDEENYAVFWVEVGGDLSSQNHTIYIYYGNSGEETTSNGENTFLLFEDNGKGEWIDEDEHTWDSYNFGGDYGLVLGAPSPGDFYTYVYKDLSEPVKSYALHYEVYMEVATYGDYYRCSYGELREDADNWVYFQHYRSGGNRRRICIAYEDGVLEVFGDIQYSPYPLRTWVNVEVRAGQNTIKTYENDILQHDLVWNRDVDFQRVRMSVRRTQAYYDNIRVRKYVVPEPAYGSWGVEEQESYVKVYVDQPLGYIPGVSVGDSFTVDMIIEVSDITDFSSEGIVGWGLNLAVDPGVLNVTGAMGAASGYFLWEFADSWSEPYPIQLSNVNATAGLADVTEQIIPSPLGGAGDPWSGLKLVTLEFTSKSETAHALIDLVNVEYMTPDGMWHPVDEVMDGYYNPPPAPDLSIKGIVLPYISMVPLIYPTPDPEFAYELNATVTNEGTADAGSFNVSFSVHLNETEVPEYGRKKPISGLAQGASETVWFDFSPENYGNYTLIIEADCDNDIVELDETNNVKMAWVIGTIRGDVDGDGDVDPFDFSAFRVDYGKTFEHPPYPSTDFDYDGDVDRYDFGIFAQNFGKTV